MTPETIIHETTLTGRVLEILFADSSIVRPWKTELADWILDRHSLTGRAIETRDLLDHLFTKHPTILERLLVNPRVKTELAVLLAVSQPGVAGAEPVVHRIPVIDKDADGDIPAH